MTPIIQADGLRKVYPARWRSSARLAVESMSFALGTGESLGIVGESGSGKSTIAKMIVGLEIPTAGTIKFDGETAPLAKSRSQRADRARHVQMVFQDPYSSLDPKQRVGDAVDEILRLHRVTSRSKRADRVEQLFDVVGLDSRFISVTPNRLSGGERQRAAIARALAADPRVLVLDEAVAALDVSIQAQILDLLSSLRSRMNTALIFISHDLSVVANVTDFVHVMRNGRVIETGPTAQVLHAPQAQYTRDLLAAVPRIGACAARRGVDRIPR